ncbi:exopolygalacturonase-like [Punica granatum]|uniref:Exopolygalacturonase-like n=1 Tax=Punica granatum TaxID=22663 RepID=A0A6P8DBV2_PUNGR|nr:exopolygalacturonase-like [Punica granatum]
MATASSLSAFVFLILCISSSLTEAQVFDVTSPKYGAKADGATDMAQALKTAWTEACASPTPSTILIPTGAFLMGQVSLGGPCKSSMTVQVQGMVKAPADPAQMKGDGWIVIQHIDSFTLNGGGTFDGQGKIAWTKNDCAEKKVCTNLPTNLRFDFVNNALIQNITTLDSKQFHVNVLGCKNITFQHVTVTAPGDSPNTDGIHIGRSNGVTIVDTHIQTGDDCISIGDGSQQVNVTAVTCGPGHGISVGSLGKWKNEEPVIGIFVKNCTITGTMNGVRIKTWPASPAGTATDMHFEDIVMNDVGNPVIIDQGYCPWNQCTAGVPSQIKISKVSFKNIRGTSSTQVAVQLSCSKAIPCEEVELADINLTFHATNGTAANGPTTSVCDNVKPVITGNQIPAICRNSTAGPPAAAPGAPANATAPAPAAPGNATAAPHP